MNEHKKRRLGIYEHVYTYDHKHVLKEVLSMKVLISRKVSDQEEDKQAIEKTMKVIMILVNK